MMLAFDITLTLLVAMLCLPVGMFCLEVLLSLFPRRQKSVPELADQARVAVLIPAHNEEAVIGATLTTLMPTIPTGCRVLVLADNCSDATAEIARSCGAEVVERTDASRRGKGFAIDFGIRHLAGAEHRSCQAPDVIVFLDADCRVTKDTVKLLASAAIATGRPVQGLNLCDPDPHGGVLQMLSGLAFRFKNLVRMLGLVRLTGVCHLTGTGMALPWQLAERVQLADGNVVEDMQLGINLAAAGQPAVFLPEARVDSPLPKQQSAARTQRTRWEHGHLQTLITQVPRLFWISFVTKRLDLFLLACDLAIPPLALLIMALASVTLAAAAAWLIGGSIVPLALSTATASFLIIAVLAGWAVHCRQQVPLVALLAGPLYIAAKLPIYAAFALQRQVEWIRTPRDPARA